MKTWNAPEIKELNWEETMSGLSQGGEETFASQCRPSDASIQFDSLYPYACGFTLDS